MAVCLVALGGRELRADDSAAEVQAVLRGYRAALLKSDGRRAVELVDDGTLAYYAKMREMALTAPAVQVKRLPMMDRLMVVFLRHRLPTEELRTMSREALFVYAVEEGWIGRNSVTDLGIGVVSIRGDEATGQVVKRGQPTSLVFSFHKQREKWRLDLRPLMTAGSSALVELARQQRVRENDLIIALTEKVTGKRVPATIWDPPH